MGPSTHWTTWEFLLHSLTRCWVGVHRVFLHRGAHLRGSGPPRTELENSVRQHTEIHRAPVHTEIVCLCGLPSAIFSTCKQITEQLNRGGYQQAAIAFSKHTLLETTGIHRSPRKYYVLVPHKTHQWKCAMCAGPVCVRIPRWLAGSKSSFRPNFFFVILYWRRKCKFTVAVAAQVYNCY